MTSTKNLPISVKQAVTAAHAEFCKNVFLNSPLTDTERHLTRKLLADPLWRPLCELEVNGATSVEGGLMLMASGLIENRPFIIRGGPAKGSTVAAVDLTERGMAQFSHYCGENGTDDKQDFMSSLIDSLQAYAAIDFGSGLIATRSMIEGAIDFDDWDLLKRLKQIPYDAPLLSGSLPPTKNVRAPRRNYLQYVAGWDGVRTGSEIISLSL